MYYISLIFGTPQLNQDLRHGLSVPDHAHAVVGEGGVEVLGGVGLLALFK